MSLSILMVFFLLTLNYHILSGFFGHSSAGIAARGPSAHRHRYHPPVLQKRGRSDRRNAGGGPRLSQRERLSLFCPMRCGRQGGRVRRTELPIILSQSTAFFKREMLNFSYCFATILLQSVSFIRFCGENGRMTAFFGKADGTAPAACPPAGW